MGPRRLAELELPHHELQFLDPLGGGHEPRLGHGEILNRDSQAVAEVNDQSCGLRAVEPEQDDSTVRQIE